MIQRIRHLILGFPENLKRITTGSLFIPEIDGLRFLAIFPVVLQHFSERMYRSFPIQTDQELRIVEFLSNGHIGVYIFFAISGFILALPFGRERIEPKIPPVSIKKYYLRRLTRLEPPYIITMTVLFFTLIIMQRFDFFSLLPHYTASLFYVHRYVYGTWSPINPPTWTLEIEVLFYLFAPLITRGYFSIVNKLKRRLLLIMLITVKIILFTSTTWFDNLYLTLFSHIEYFCIGILMADIYLTEKFDKLKTLYIYDAIAMVSIITLFSFWTWDKNLIYKFVFCLALFMTLYSSFRSVIVKSFFRNNWITSIGGMCYTIYLIHLPLAEFFVWGWKRITFNDSYIINFSTGLVLFLTVTLFISIIFYLLIERPCMDPAWPQKFKKFFKSLVLSKQQT